ncbi:MAG: GNAT family N-acetyltransferase [Hyphomicrobiales bacterium]
MARFARPADASQVVALYHAVWHETQAPFMPIEERTRRTLTFFVRRVSALRATTLVEERGGSIVGFSAWSGRLLGQIFVAKAFRGTNVAPLLMAAAEREMADRGIAEAELHCVVGNDRARRFYERMGWTHQGEIFEPVLGKGGEVGVAFWRMIKTLCQPNK